MRLPAPLILEPAGSTLAVMASPERRGLAGAFFSRHPGVVASPVSPPRAAAFSSQPSHFEACCSIGFCIASNNGRKNSPVVARTRRHAEEKSSLPLDNTDLGTMA